MLEHLVHPRLLWYNTTIDIMVNLSSKKIIGADNQQGRLNFAYWISGFTDGEGCFSIAIINNDTTKFGKQIFPEFVVTQGEKNLSALKKIKSFFKCGNIYINRRYDNHNENIYRYCVRSINDLAKIIIPFFDNHSLYTSKKGDFLIFKKVVKDMISKKHLNDKGFKKILLLVEGMNRKKKRYLEPSETIRETHQLLNKIKKAC